MACSGAAVASSAEAEGGGKEGGGDGPGYGTVSEKAECGNITVSTGDDTARRDSIAVVGADRDAATVTVAGTRVRYC